MFPHFYRWVVIYNTVKGSLFIIPPPEYARFSLYQCRRTSPFHTIALLPTNLTSVNWVSNCFSFGHVLPNDISLEIDMIDIHTLNILWKKLSLWSFFSIFTYLFTFYSAFQNQNYIINKNRLYSIMYIKCDL